MCVCDDPQIASESTNQKYLSSKKKITEFNQSGYEPLNLEKVSFYKQ